MIAGQHLPQRWIFAIMGFLAILNAYTMRVCLSITITEMTKPIEHNYTDDTCPSVNNKTSSDNSNYDDRYDWDERTQVKDTLHEYSPLITTLRCFICSTFTFPPFTLTFYLYFSILLIFISSYLFFAGYYSLVLLLGLRRHTSAGRDTG